MTKAMGLRLRIWSAAVVLVCFGAGNSVAQHSSHPVHPVMPDQNLFVRVQPLEGSDRTAVQVPVTLVSPLLPTDLDQTVALPGGGGGNILLRKFLPQAALEQRAVSVDGGSGKPAIELSIEGPTQSLRRWLIADDPERNRLSSFIGTWRFMTAGSPDQADSLFKQFETEFTREPQLAVSRRDGSDSRTLNLRIDETQPLDGLGCALRVLRFFPDYGVVEEKNEAINRSEHRRNPAAEVDVTCGDRSSRRWIFAKFPSFGGKSSDEVPIQITLDCPVEGTGNAPDFVITNLGGGERFEAWVRHQGKVDRGSLKVREFREVVGSQYKCQILSFLPSARLVEEYKPVTQGTGSAALLVQVPDVTGGEKTLWLGVGESRTVASKYGLLSVGFLTQAPSRPGAHP